jgi:small subunit ribosomal protein S21
VAIRIAGFQGEPGERLLQRFKRICVRSGLFRELKRRRAYEKPSARRRRKAEECQRALRRALRRKARLARRASE